MDYSLLLGIHDCNRAAEFQTLAAARKGVSSNSDEEGACASSPPRAGGGDSSEADGGSLGSVEYGSQPTPPDSPLPSTGAFAPLPADLELDLDAEFYAIPSRVGKHSFLIDWTEKTKVQSALRVVSLGSECM